MDRSGRRWSVVLLATFALACTPNDAGPPNISPTVSPDSSIAREGIRKWPLRGNPIAWDSRGEFFVYAADVSGTTSILGRDLDSGPERVIQELPRGSQMGVLKVLPGGIVYTVLLSRGGPSRRADAYEVRFHDLGSGRDSLLEESTDEVFEGAEGNLLAPSLTSNGAAVIWSRFALRGEQVSTKFLQWELGATPFEFYSISEVGFAKALSGSQLVIWTRPFGAHNSPTSISTQLVSNGAIEILDQGVAHIDISEEGAVLLFSTGRTEVRSRLGGNQVSEATLSPPGIPSLGEGFLVWCADNRINWLILDNQDYLSAPAQGCQPLVEADGSSVVWIESAEGTAVVANLKTLPR